MKKHFVLKGTILVGALLASNSIYAQWTSASGVTSTTDKVGIGTTGTPPEKLTVNDGNIMLTRSSYPSDYGGGSNYRYISAHTQYSILHIGTDPNTITAEANGPMIQMLGTSNGWVPGRINYYARSSVAGSSGTTCSHYFNNWNATTNSWIQQLQLHDFNGKAVVTVGNAPDPITADYGLSVGNGILSRVYASGGGYTNLMDLKTIGGQAVAIIGNVVLPTIPNNYGLIVERGILTPRIRVAIQGTPEWADYVFAEDYKLMPLKKLEEYINTENHLPEIPTTEQVLQEGVDVGKMQAKLLQKVEELTLYVIQQQKEIEALKKKVRHNL